jgi:N-methylhydantoinase B
MSEAPYARALDPTTFAVISRALQSIAEEMAITFEYSALSSILSEARDFSCAIYAAGDPPSAVCNLPAIPVHINAQPVATGHIARFFGDEVYEGDVMMVNSSYYGGTHIGDLVVACPVFYRGRHLFWAVATGHQADVGSGYNTSVPVQATDIWKEGIQIPPLKLEERGELRRDVLSLYLENLRYREFCHGDLMSQVGSVKTAKRRLVELLDEWGADVIEQFSREIVEYSDRRTSAEIATWPDGVYRAESWVDSDGHGIEHIAIRCTLTIAGEDLRIDFAGSDPQARGGVNASWAVCQNAATTPIVLCLDPDLPHNEGCLRHIQVSAPEGTITNVAWPGCTADSTIVPADAISDAVWKCLAQAVPEKAVAGFGHIAPNQVSSGYDRREPGQETPWTAIFFNGSSGGGACREHDGWPMMYSPGTVGSLSFVPIEVLELHYPVLVRRHELRTDSMGAGRTRGGPGVTFHVEPRGTGQIDNYPYGDGMSNPPFGLFGGLPGDGGALYRTNADGTRTFFSMIGYYRVREGEAWVALATGGGGYGDPFERDPEKVVRDVRDGLVSREAAERDYGVVLTDGGVAVDVAATAQRRGAGRRDRLPTIQPLTPDAGAFHRGLMRPGDGFELNAHPPTDADLTL